MFTSPAPTAVTTPVDVTVATDVLPLVQVPPAVASANVTVEPAQRKVPPVIGAGIGLTVKLTATKLPLCV